jgi:hypothetical protein
MHKAGETCLNYKDVADSNTIEKCAAGVQAELNAGTCSSVVFEYNPSTGDCNCCSDDSS